MNEITVNQATMSTLELVDYINAGRKEKAEKAGHPFPSKGHAEIKHKSLLTKVEKHSGIHSAKFFAEYTDSTGRALKCYNLPEFEARLIVMSESLEVQTRVLRRMMDLEEQVKLGRQHQIPTNMTLVPKDLLKRCMYLGPKGRPTAQAKYLAKMQLPLIGQIGVTNEFGLTPGQLEEVERASLLTLYAVQAHNTDSSYHIEMQMLQDQKALEQVAKQKEKKKLQKQIANAQERLKHPDLTPAPLCSYPCRP